MQLSCLPVSRYEDLSAGRCTLCDWFRQAAALSLDGADLSVAHVSSRAPATLDAIRREATDAGVQIAIVAAYSDFVHPDARTRARQVDDVRRWLEACDRLGAAALRLTAGQDRGDVQVADGLSWIADGLAASAEAAQAGRVRVLFENHVRGLGWERHDFAQAASRFLEVVRRTDGTGLEVLFDTGNCLALDEDPMEVLEAVLDRIGAVHVSDMKRRGAFEPTVLGTGVAPIASLLGRLVSSGFDGWVSVEEASRTGDVGFRRAVAFADRAWLEAGGRPRGARKPGFP